MSPFPGATARARGAAAQAYAAGRAQLRLADELPPAWRPIVADCLAPNHAQRSVHSAAALLERIRALPEEGAARRLVRRAAPRSTRGRIGAAAALVAAVAGAALALGMPGDAPPARPAPVTVYNAEQACRHSTRPTCRLGLARDPSASYVAINIAARVRHGDRLVAECYVPDGTRVMAEDGRQSRRWYRVRSPSGEAWLPAVRAWPGQVPAVGRCS
jgi:serine/threonine-protein kinase